MVETAKYDIIRVDGEFEIRLYQKILVASVENSVESPFNILFSYISGANKLGTKIAMTSPVITSEKIAMTSPVISTSESMSFIVPSKYDSETLPEPRDQRILIGEIPERKVAVVKFKGLTRKENVKKQTDKLLKWLTDQKIEIEGAPFLLRYNPPYIPWFLRRNEVGIEIKFED